MFKSHMPKSKHRCMQGELDSDVVLEQEKAKFVLTRPEPCSVSVVELHKEFRVNNKLSCFGGRTLVAVDNLSFCVERGECFCLLGANGSGKSVTFKTITTQITPTSGEIHIVGKKTGDVSSRAKRIFGYCPQ